MQSFFWTVDVREAEREQLVLRELVKHDTDSLQFMHGLAVGTAYDENSKRCVAVGIPFDSEGRCSAPTDIKSKEVDFPYVPGLLAFRVGPAVCALLDEAIEHVDLLLFDAQGIAHPRRMGLAAHIGVLYNKPSIGVTRNALFGRFVDPLPGRFTYTKILHPETNVAIGYAVSMGEHCRPFYVSPGHRVTHQEALNIVRRVAGKEGCFPRPLRRAHARANAAARSLWQELLPHNHRGEHERA